MENLKCAAKNDKEKIVIDKDIQIEMMKFFMETSIPRLLKKKEKESRS